MGLHTHGTLLFLLTICSSQTCAFSDTVKGITRANGTGASGSPPPVNGPSSNISTTEHPSPEASPSTASQTSSRTSCEDDQCTTYQCPCTVSVPWVSQLQWGPRDRDATAAPPTNANGTHIYIYPTTGADGILINFTLAFPTQPVDYDTGYFYAGATPSIDHGSTTCASISTANGTSYSDLASHPPYSGPAQTLPVTPSVAPDQLLGLHYQPFWASIPPIVTDLEYFFTAFPDATLLRSCQPDYYKSGAIELPELAVETVPRLDQPSMGPSSAAPAMAPAAAGAMPTSTTTMNAIESTQSSGDAEPAKSVAPAPAPAPAPEAAGAISTKTATKVIVATPTSGEAESANTAAPVSTPAIEATASTSPSASHIATSSLVQTTGEAHIPETFLSGIPATSSVGTSADSPVPFGLLSAIYSAASAFSSAVLPMSSQSSSNAQSMQRTVTEATPTSVASTSGSGTIAAAQSISTADAEIPLTNEPSHAETSVSSGFGSSGFVVASYSSTATATIEPPQSPPTVFTPQISSSTKSSLTNESPDATSLASGSGKTSEVATTPSQSLGGYIMSGLGQGGSQLNATSPSSGTGYHASLETAQSGSGPGVETCRVAAVLAVLGISVGIWL